jgi:hypothetical protein
MYGPLVVLHLLGAFAFAAGNVGGVLITSRARRETAPTAILALMRAHALAIGALVVPGAVVALLTGGALVTVIQARFASVWIAGSLALWVASLLLGVGVLLRPQDRAIAEARRLVAAGTDVATPELARHVGGPAVVAGEWAQVAIVIALVALMALKP